MARNGLVTTCEPGNGCVGEAQPCMSGVSKPCFTGNRFGKGLLAQREHVRPDRRALPGRRLAVDLSGSGRQLP